MLHDGAAIEAGAHYLDICDDWEPTLDMLELGERARARGVTAVIGMGASPGLTNLLAMKAGKDAAARASMKKGVPNVCSSRSTATERPGVSGTFAAATGPSAGSSTGASRKKM